MKRKRITIAAALIASISAWNVASATPMSEMSVDEVSSLLASGSTVGNPAVLSSLTVKPAKMTATADVDAVDMMTKVYGIVPDKTCRRADCVALNAKEDEGYLWLDSADGYTLRYSDMTPHVSAAARMDDSDRVEEYCYFFLFPYLAGQKVAATRAQSEFAGALLQEMMDRCESIGADPMTEDLIYAEGVYGDNNVKIRLLDRQAEEVSSDHISSKGNNTSGCYILMLVVDPGSASMAYEPE